MGLPVLRRVKLGVRTRGFQLASGTALGKAIASRGMGYDPCALLPNGMVGERGAHEEDTALLPLWPSRPSPQGVAGQTPRDVAGRGAGLAPGDASVALRGAGVSQFGLRDRLDLSLSPSLPTPIAGTPRKGIPDTPRIPCPTQLQKIGTEGVLGPKDVVDS